MFDSEKLSGFYWYTNPLNNMSSSVGLTIPNISHKIHGAGIYTNIWAIWMGSMLPYIKQHHGSYVLSKSCKPSKIPRAQSAKPLTYWFSLFMSCFTLVYEKMAWRKLQEIGKASVFNHQIWGCTVIIVSIYQFLGLPSGKLISYGKWWFIVDLPIKTGDFP